uniref:Unk like zinc finger n=1 Tax=Lynx canadensis TaxID=61383 RepID=A0A667ILK9_LYNCA
IGGGGAVDGESASSAPRRQGAGRRYAELAVHPRRGPAVDLHPGEVSLAPLDKELEEHDLGDLGPAGLNGVPGSIWDFVSGSFSPSPSPILNAGPAPASSASPSGAELARVRRQLDEAKRKIRQWEESWQQVKQACDAWQREAKEAKERALAADSARQLALQKKEEVEAQFRRLREELEGRGPGATLPGLPRCADLGATPLPKLHSLQTRLRLDLEAVDGVSPGATTLFLPRLPALPSGPAPRGPESPSRVAAASRPVPRLVFSALSYGPLPGQGSVLEPGAPEGSRALSLAHSLPPLV